MLERCGRRLKEECPLMNATTEMVYHMYHAQWNPRAVTLLGNGTSRHVNVHEFARLGETPSSNSYSVTGRKGKQINESLGTSRRFAKEET